MALVGAFCLGRAGKSNVDHGFEYFCFWEQRRDRRQGLRLLVCLIFMLPILLLEAAGTRDVGCCRLMR